MFYPKSVYEAKGVNVTFLIYKKGLINGQNIEISFLYQESLFSTTWAYLSSTSKLKKKINLLGLLYPRELPIIELIHTNGGEHSLEESDCCYIPQPGFGSNLARARAALVFTALAVQF